MTPQDQKSGGPALGRGGSKSVERRLANVVHMDMVGYSRLVGTAEIETLARWRTLRTEVIEPIIREHLGRVVSVTGDALLLEFASAVQGVACAIALQRTIDNANKDLPPGTRLEFRIGAHVGDVVVEGHDIAGNDVNIAVRLQSRAEPGGLLISAAARERVGKHLPFEFEEVGPLALKNISDVVRAYRWRRQPSRAETITATSTSIASRYRRPSIAVMPFENLTGDPELAYIASGVVADIISLLSRLPSVLVISRDTTVNLRSARADDEKVAQSLDVRYLLVGSLRRSGGKYVISAELIDADSSAVLWADRVSTAPQSIFELQDGVAAKVVERIVPQIEASELGRVLRKHPKSLDAYDLTLMALAHDAALVRSQTEEGMNLLSRAIEIDPSYADAYAWLAKAHILRIAQGWSANPTFDRQSAAKLSSSAVTRDPSGPLGLAIQGHCRAFLLRDYDSAQSAFARALRASPSHPIAWTYSALTQAYLGNARPAIDQAHYALRLSPFDLHASLLYLTLGLAHYVNRDDESAIAALRRSTEDSAHHSAAWRVLVWTLARSGRIDASREAAAKLIALEPQFRVSDYRKRAPFSRKEAREEVAALLLEAGLPS